jgi:hypothetical protein
MDEISRRGKRTFELVIMAKVPILLESAESR